MNNSLEDFVNWLKKEKERTRLLTMDADFYKRKSSNVIYEEIVAAEKMVFNYKAELKNL